MKALAYIKNSPIQYAGCNIDKDEQQNEIIKYACDNNISICAWFEDTEEIKPLSEKGAVKHILSHSEDYDIVLVERISVLSKNYKELEPFLDILKSQGVKLQSTKYLWDIVSQKCRAKFRT